MASQYDFKNLERNISSLENDFSRFNDKFEEIIYPIIRAYFDEKKYGSREIEKQINKIVNGTKKNMNSLFNSLIRNINNAIDSSKERIKEKENSIISYVNDKNLIINNLNDINILYTSKDYKEVIKKCNELGDNFGNDEIRDYIKLSKIMAYDGFCSNALKSFEPDSYSYFTSYFSECKRYSANKHIVIACEYLFIASFLKIKKCLSDLDCDEAYSICNNAIECYKRFDEDLMTKYQSMYSEVYNVAISLFNSISENAYNNFNYSKVVKLLSDSNNYNSSDIDIDFFKDSSCNEEKLFDYIKSFGMKGTIEDRKIALKGTISLVKTDKRESFINYWINTYDDNDYSFIDKIIKIQENRFIANNLILNAIRQNTKYISKKGELCLNLIKDYYIFLKEIYKRIPLDDFTDLAINLNSFVRTIKNTIDAGNDLKLKEAIKIIDELNYGMLVKYQKKCILYTESKISDLNMVLNDSS